MERTDERPGCLRVTVSRVGETGEETMGWVSLPDEPAIVEALQAIAGAVRQAAAFDRRLPPVDPALTAQGALCAAVRALADAWTNTYRVAAYREGAS